MKHFAAICQHSLHFSLKKGEKHAFYFSMAQPPMTGWMPPPPNPHEGFPPIFSRSTRNFY